MKSIPITSGEAAELKVDAKHPQPKIKEDNKVVNPAFEKWNVIRSRFCGFAGYFRAL
jgi:hypothetical protein